MPKRENVVYPYIPNSVPETKKKMMQVIGINDIMELYEREIPDALRFKGEMQLPEPIYDEYSIKRHTEKILSKNKNTKDNISFLGAGCAQHFIPAVCDEISGRGEFLTAYVGESIADHGKWQTLFEYCSLMAELCDMDVLSIPMYDGAQAVGSSIRMANRINGKSKVLIPEKMNPEVLMTLQNYTNSMPQPDIQLIKVKCDNQGRLDINDLNSKVSPDISAIFIENPTFLGTIENQVEQIAKAAQTVGAEFIVYADPISLGVLEAPANYGASITCGDFHNLGVHMQAGGGQGGFIATFDDMKYIAEFKDLMFGITETVVEGEYGFGEVLFDRTSYGSRDKAKEFTGTSTGLWAITAAVYLAIMGPKGMEEVGTTIMQMSQYAVQKLSQIPGVQVTTQAPFFKEFVVNFDMTGKTVEEINKTLMGNKIFGGLDLSTNFPDLGQSALYCVTEVHTKDDIDKMVYALQGALSC